MSEALARALLGVQSFPNYGDVATVPEPYRTTVKQSRAMMKKLKGSHVGEPGEAEKPITEEPTNDPS